VVPYNLDDQHSVLRACIQHTDLLVNTELQYISSNLQWIDRGVKADHTREERRIFFEDCSVEPGGGSLSMRVEKRREIKVAD
jgi:hypothetical protein